MCNVTSVFISVCDGYELLFLFSWCFDWEFVLLCLKVVMEVELGRLVSYITFIKSSEGLNLLCLTSLFCLRDHIQSSA